MPPAPSGYTYLAHHAVGDSERNTRSNMDPPDNLVDNLPPCTASPGAQHCLTVAHTACEGRTGCLAFSLLNQGAKEDPATVSGYQLFRAGIGNAFVNADWYLYAKAKPCSSCPSSGAAVAAVAPAGAASGAPVQTHQCITLGNIYPCGHPGRQER